MERPSSPRPAGPLCSQPAPVPAAGAWDSRRPRPVSFAGHPPQAGRGDALYGRGVTRLPRWRPCCRHHPRVQVGKPRLREGKGDLVRVGSGRDWFRSPSSLAASRGASDTARLTRTLGFKHVREPGSRVGARRYGPPPRPCCVTLSEPFYPAGPRLPHLENGVMTDQPQRAAGTTRCDAVACPRCRPGRGRLLPGRKPARGVPWDGAGEGPSPCSRGLGSVLLIGPGWVQDPGGSFSDRPHQAVTAGHVISKEGRGPWAG